MTTDKVDLLKQLSMLAALSTEVVVQFDDVVEKAEDCGLLARMGVTEEDCHQVERILRRFQNNAHDQLGTVERELRSDLAKPARPEFPVDNMWKDAEAAHPGPYVYESNLLPPMPETQTPEDKQAPVAKADR